MEDWQTLVLIAASTFDLLLHSLGLFLVLKTKIRPAFSSNQRLYLAAISCVDITTEVLNIAAILWATGTTIHEYFLFTLAVVAYAWYIFITSLVTIDRFL